MLNEIGNCCSWFMKIMFDFVTMERNEKICDFKYNFLLIFPGYELNVFQEGRGGYKTCKGLVG